MTSTYRFSRPALLALIVAAVFVSGCLNVGSKVYSFKVNADGSGQGTIRYLNIVSTDDNSKDVSFKDFATLVTDYVDGTKFEDDYPYFHVTGKKLVEENGTLVGEVTFTFTSFDSAGFLRREKCDCCPTMYFVKSDNGSETVTETNGKLVENVASSPFIEWEPAAKEYTLKTTIMTDTSGARNLVSYYRSWKDKK